MGVNLGCYVHRAFRHLQVSQFALWRSFPAKSCNPSIFGPVQRVSVFLKDVLHLLRLTFPIVEEASAIDKDMAPIIDFSALHINLDLVCKELVRFKGSES